MGILLSCFFFFLFGAQAQAEDPLVKLQNVSWAGANQDPMSHYVDWASEISPSVCWVGSPPPGWGEIDPMAKLVVINNSSQPIQIRMDESVVDVVDSPLQAGGQRFPSVCIVRHGQSTERITFLRTGASCYGVLTYKSERTARQIGWKVSAKRLSVRGRGQWLQAGGMWFYTAPMAEGATSRSSVNGVLWRGQRYSRIEYRDGDF